MCKSRQFVNPGACAHQGHSMAMLTAAWGRRKRIENTTFPRGKSSVVSFPLLWASGCKCIRGKALNTDFLCGSNLDHDVLMYGTMFKCTIYYYYFFYLSEKNNNEINLVFIYSLSK